MPSETLIDVCRLDELPPGAHKVVEVDDLEIGVVNCGGELLAIEDRCSHDDGTLAEGELDQERVHASNAPATARCSTCAPASR